MTTTMMGYPSRRMGASPRASSSSSSSGSSSLIRRRQLSHADSSSHNFLSHGLISLVALALLVSTSALSPPLVAAPPGLLRLYPSSSFFVSAMTNPSIPAAHQRGPALFPRQDRDGDGDDDDDGDGHHHHHHSSSATADETTADAGTATGTDSTPDGGDAGTTTQMPVDPPLVPSSTDSPLQDHTSVGSSSAAAAPAPTGTTSSSLTSASRKSSASTSATAAAVSPTSSPASAGNNASSAFPCPPPFERSPFNATGYSRCIAGNCCMPCPAAFNALPPNYMHNIWLREYTPVVIISMVSAAVVIFSFLCVPFINRRREEAALKRTELFDKLGVSSAFETRSATGVRFADSPADSLQDGGIALAGSNTLAFANGRPFVVSMNFGIFVELVGVFMSVPDPTWTICVSQFDSADVRNSSRCLLQGLIFLFGVHATILSVAAILVNVHLTVVWKNKILEKYFVTVLVAIWSIAAGLSSLSVLRKKIIGLPAFICSVQPDDMLASVYAPDILFMIVPFFLQIWTLVFSIVRGRRSISRLDETRHIVRREIRSQLRAFILALAFQISWAALFFAFNEVRVFANSFVTPGTDSTSNLSFAREWFACLIAQNPNGQANCSSVILRNVPNVPKMAGFVSAHLGTGIYSVVILVLTHPAILAEWRTFLFPKAASSKTTTIVVSSSDMLPLGPTRRPDFLKPVDGASMASRSSSTSSAFEDDDFDLDTQNDGTDADYASRRSADDARSSHRGSRVEDDGQDGWQRAVNTS
ncbi:hypothetical protein DFJ73DRAFT_62320 [Zopfochytrium polystomum]|nr:hypothetical protein DFJ73DRAFT_62320 [Zopfochytrium polystomum]